MKSCGLILLTESESESEDASKGASSSSGKTTERSASAERGRKDRDWDREKGRESRGSVIEFAVKAAGTPTFARRRTSRNGADITSIDLDGGPLLLLLSFSFSFSFSLYELCCAILFS